MIEYGYRKDGSWKGQLGWSFTAEECAREREFIKEMQEWWKRFKGKTIVKESETAAFEMEWPEEMDRDWAVDYARVSPETLMQAVRNGVLPYHLHDDEGRRKMKYFWRKDLDKWTADMAREKYRLSPSL